jgi:hypothetical protein
LWNYVTGFAAFLVLGVMFIEASGFCFLCCAVCGWYQLWGLLFYFVCNLCFVSCGVFGMSYARSPFAYIYIYIWDVSSEKGVSYMRVRGFIFHRLIKTCG